MDAQINSNEPNDLKNGLSSSVPSLPSDLKSLYLNMGDDEKRLFNRVYVSLWGVVNTYNIKRSGIASYYWLLSMVAGASSLAPSSLVVLSYLYMMSNKGSKLIHSNTLYLSGCVPGALFKTYQRITWDLKHDGYITRHTKDPGQPYNHKAQHNRQPVYIKITGKGLKIIEGMEKDVNKILLNTSFNDLTGIKKPG